MPHPVADARVLDVHELGADRVGVDALELRDHFAQPHRFAVEEKSRRNFAIEIGLAETKLAQIEQRIFGTLVGQRIQPRDGVTERLVSVNQPIDARRE